MGKVRAATTTLSETLPYVEFGGIRMDRGDYGRPPEGAGIEIVTDGRPLSEYDPECAEDPEFP